MFVRAIHTASTIGVPGVPLDDDEPLDGHLRVYALDPFGDRVELLEPTGPAHR
jgi:hypothetical protein